MLRGLAAAALMVVVGCARPAAPTLAHPMDGYTSAVEEAVWRYECDAERAARRARRLPPHRYEHLLRRALRSRGLTIESYRALAPRFRGTQLAPYVIRLDDAELRAAAGVTASVRADAP